MGEWAHTQRKLNNYFLANRKFASSANQYLFLMKFIKTMNHRSSIHIFTLLKKFWGAALQIVKFDRLLQLNSINDWKVKELRGKKNSANVANDDHFHYIFMVWRFERGFKSNFNWNWTKQFVNETKRNAMKMWTRAKHT